MQVFVRELHNIPVIDPDNGLLKEARDAENNIIISDSTLRSLLSPKFKKCHQDARSCMVFSVVYMPKVYITHYYNGVINIEKTQGTKPKCSKQKFWEKIKSHI